MSFNGTSVGLDVHALSVVAHAVDEETGRVERARLCPDHGEILDWLHRLRGPVRVAYEAGPTGFGLARALADAQIDSTPLVCITGQVFAHLLGTDAFQETDVINITTPVTKWNYQVTDANEIPEAIAKAFYIARTGRPGSTTPQRRWRRRARRDTRRRRRWSRRAPGSG